MHARSHSPPRHAAALAALATCACAVLAPTEAPAQASAPDTSYRLRLGGFVDAYYAWDFGEPPTRDRSFAGGALFTTQPSRHNEFNVNLAFVEATLAGPRVRGRLALQAGTSVQANYAFEPTEGTVSGPTLSRHVQEAFAGYRVAERLWIDAGIFFSHMGMESWVSRDNPTYTRSLVADYSPYYSSGVRAVWQASSRLTAHLHVVNGWQNVSENNDGKGVGLRLDHVPAAGATLSYFGFLSDEAGTRLRTFNGVGAKLVRGPWTLLGEFDVGTQRRPAGEDGASSWLNTQGTVRYALTRAVALSVRAEHADDEDGIVLATGTRPSDAGEVANPPFRAVGGSVGLDVQPVTRVLWRTEARGWRNDEAIFPDGRSAAPRRSSGFVVTSLAVTF